MHLRENSNASHQLKLQLTITMTKSSCNVKNFVCFTAYMKSFYGFASRFSVALFSLGMLIIFSTYKGNMIASLAGTSNNLDLESMVRKIQSLLGFLTGVFSATFTSHTHIFLSLKH